MKAAAAKRDRGETPRGGRLRLAPPAAGACHAAGMQWDAYAARRRSSEELARHGIEVPPSLPLLLEPHELDRLRPVTDVVARTQALFEVIALREGAPAEQVRASIDKGRLDPWLSEREKRFVAQPDDHQELIAMSWRIESILALGWALGLVDDLPLEGAEGVPAETFAPIHTPGSRSPQFQLRPVHEIADRLDLFYCGHWAAVEHRLSGAFSPWPDALVPGAILERRHGLEWLFADPEFDWEQIDLST